MTKQRKINLLIFFIVLGLLMFHPFGRVLVRFFIPVGINAVELVGFLCFAAVIIIILFPSDVIVRKVKNIGNIKGKGNKYARFMNQLLACDRYDEFVPRYKKIIEVSRKRKKQKYMEYFIDYYGELTLKLLETKTDFLENNVSNEINEAINETNQALQEMKDICDKFIGQLFATEIADLQADISEKLKSKNS